MAFALSHALVSTSGTMFPETSGYFLFFQKQTQGISILRIFQLSNTVLHPYLCMQCVNVSMCVCGSVRACVRACVRVCVCVYILHIVMLESLLMSTLCVKYLLNSGEHSLSRCTLCMLCLFSALSCGVGTLPSLKNCITVGCMFTGN